MDFFTNLFWNRVLWETTESPRCFFLHPWRPFVFVYRTVRKTRQVGAPPTSIAFSNFPISLLLTRDPNHAIDASVRMSSLRIPVDHLWPKCEVILVMSIVNGWKDVSPQAWLKTSTGNVVVFAWLTGIYTWPVESFLANLGVHMCALNRANSINSGRKSLTRREAFMEKPHPRKGVAWQRCRIHEVIVVLAARFHTRSLTETFPIFFLEPTRPHEATEPPLLQQVWFTAQ